MTIIKARKIMGLSAEEMSDVQIQAIIDCFSGLIEVGFESFEKFSGRSAGVNRASEVVRLAAPSTR